MANTATRQVSIFINEKEVTNNIKAIAAEKKKLWNQINLLTVGTEEYEQKVKEFQKLDGIITEHQQKLKGVEQAWYKNIPAVQNFLAVGAGLFAVDKIVSYGQHLGQLSVQTDALARKSLTVLADQLDNVTAEADKNAKAMGLTGQQYVAATANVADLLIPMGFQRKEASDISLQLVNLSGALSEWSGGTKSAEDAQHALSGALLGEREELKSYGIALSEEDVKQRLVAKGMGDLTGKRLEQAKAIATLELVLEKSTDAQASFATNTDSLIRQSAEMKAKFAEISENLSKIFVPILAALAKTINAIIEPLANITEGIENLINPAKASTEAFKQQNAIVRDLEKTTNPLIDKYQRLSEKSEKLGGVTHLNKNEQLELKNIIQQLGQTVPSAVTEFDKYGKALGINVGKVKEYVEAQKALAQFTNRKAIKENEYEKKLLEGQVQMLTDTRDKIKSGEIVGTAGFFAKDFKKDVIAKNEAVEKYNNQLAAVQTNLNGISLTLKELKGEPLVDIPTASSTPSVTEPESNKAKQEREKIENELEKLREAITKHRADLRQQETNDDERDAERIKEKYRKDIEAAKELETKKVKGAGDLRIQLEQLQEDEITAKQSENTTKRLDKIKDIQAKYEAEFRTAKLTGIDKDLSDINAKYDAEIRKLKDIQGNDPNAAGAAQGAEAQIEAARRAEVQAVRDKYDLEYTDKVKAFLNEIAQLQADDETRELAQLEVKHTELLLKADKLGISEFEITKWYQEQKTKIEKEYIDKRAKQREDDHKKAIDAEKKKAEAEVKIQDAKVAALKDLSTFLGEVIGEAGRKSFGFFLLQKAIAAGEVVLNMMKELAAHAAYAASMGPAGIPYLATMSAITKIRTAFALGTIAAQTVTFANQKYEGGYSKVVGAQDGRTYDAQVSSNFQGGFAPHPMLLVGERGEEYVIPDYLLKNPMIANFANITEAIRTNRYPSSPQRMEGGSTTEGGQTTTNIQPSNISDNRAVILLENIYDALLSGRIIAIVDTEGALKIDKLIAQGKKIRGY